MQLSKRLLAVAGMVTSGNCLADVGTDHGYIPIYLIEQGRIAGAIAMDIHSGPLKRADENIKHYHLEERIQTRLSDGLSALHRNEADSVVMAGMGGGLIMKIISEGREILETVREFTLQPQSEIDLVRKFLQREGYCIAAENMILEDGKFYPMMRVVHGAMKLNREIEFKYGPMLLREKNGCLKEFLAKEYFTYQQIRSKLLNNKNEKAMKRLKEIEHELKLIREAKEEVL